MRFSVSTCQKEQRLSRNDQREKKINEKKKKDAHLEVIKGFLEGNGAVKGSNGMIEENLSTAIKRVAQEQRLHVKTRPSFGSMAHLLQQRQPMLVES